MTNAKRIERGQRNFHAGQAAEEQVARRYERDGHRILSRRWRGPLGEIDLIAEKDGETVFVEVKSAADFSKAAQSLTRRQIDRLLRSAEHYIGALPTGSLTPMRFDVALVDRSGRMEILPNALMT
ncbi:YraN family protein [Maritalea mobilis]|uniref:YraN family protein n=1 Tax=Maritalea mobilis TaxID=483324 RepID=UPI001C93E8F2|nr:YraN family protein [Maritalea mobilis]MBY6201353.1 YraN family protein [Maritalea mobilis]